MPNTWIDMYLDTIPTDLFRSGNASGPRLDIVRSKDIELYEDLYEAEGSPAGKVTFVKGESGGISTFDALVSGQKKWWKIPQGTEIPAGLAVTQDHAQEKGKRTHYSIRPAHDMPLRVYKAMLEELARSAVRVP